MPSAFSVSASGSTHSGANTPTICRLTPAGLESGPSRLKIVRVPISSAGRPDMAHRRMMRRREHEADAGFADAVADRFGRDVDLDAERGEHVGGAGLRGKAAIAMLGDRHAGAGDHEGRRRRDVDAVRAVAAGADDVDGAFGRFDPQHLLAHGGDRAGDLVDRLAAHAQRHQERADLAGRRFAGHDRCRTPSALRRR